MSEIKITPTRLRGTLAVPQSKSLAHRIAIAEALAGGNPASLGLEPSADSSATIEGIQRLKQGERQINCGESASTLRFLLPISLVMGRGADFFCEASLTKRPLTPYYPIFNQCSIAYGYEPSVEKGQSIFRVGGRLSGGAYDLDGAVSSQFISGLLFALPVLSVDSTIRVTGTLESRAYVNLTCYVLEQYGIHIVETNKQTFFVKGNQRYRKPEKPLPLEGDYSQAAFFLCANELGSAVSVTNLNPRSLQGDQQILSFLEKMRICKKTGKTFIADGSQCPDLMPILAVTAALQEGLHTEIKGAKRLRIKECDRIEAICREMGELGATIVERQDGFIIEGKRQLRGGILVWSHKDHRIAMCMAIAAMHCANPVVLKDWECITKSYPGFFRDFRALGGLADEWNVGK